MRHRHYFGWFEEEVWLFPNRVIALANFNARWHHCAVLCIAPSRSVLLISAVSSAFFGHFQDGESWSWNTKMDRQQNEVQRVAETALVLSNVSETMPWRERLQVPHNVRVASASVVTLRRRFTQIPQRVQQRVREMLPQPSEAPVWNQTSPCQYCLPRVILKLQPPIS